MDRQTIFWKNLIIGTDQTITFDNVNGVGETKFEVNTTSYKTNLFKFSTDQETTKGDFKSRLKTTDCLISEKQMPESVRGPYGDKKNFLHRPGSVLDDNPTRLVSALRGNDNINGRGGRRGRVERSLSGFQLFSWNGRRRSNRKRHAYQLQRSHCGLCVPRNKSRNKGLKNWNRACGRWALSENAMRLLSRTFVNNECSLINYKSNRLSQRSLTGQLNIADLIKRVNNNDNNNNDEKKLSPSFYVVKKKSASKKQRRIGIVENPFLTELSIFRSVRNLIKNFSSLLEEKKGRLEGDGTTKTGEINSMIFSSLNKTTEMIANPDIAEGENNREKDDIFKLPMARITNKSLNSDEGIEPDPEQKRDSVARCWSLDSAIPSDDDSSQNPLPSKDERVRVTRCCSSDSAVLSDDDQNKVWGSPSANYAAECETSDGQPRYWRTPSVVVSDFSEYSYLEEKFERNNIEDKFEGNGSPSQTSSCSCFDCDEIRQSTENSLSLDFHLLQICRHRRHSDSCCLCVGSKNSITQRRNSCLASPGPYYPKLMRSEGSSPNSEISESNSEDRENKSQGEFLDIPMCRKISDCSTNSSLSGDDCEITELQPIQRPKTSGWRKLRNIVQWTPFFQTYKKQRYPWVQLAGHQGNFRAGPTPGTILKKLCPQEEACFRLLMRDVLRPYVPEFKGVLDVRESENGVEQDADLEADSKERDGGVNARKSIMASYLQLQDLLGDFEQPCVMDCKVGVRTYLESELAKAKERPKLRKDMYEKMVQVDPSAPTAEERRVQGVTKPRYMVWRETISSTATLGFRVEGIKRAQGGSTKDFKTTRTLEQVTEALKRFTEGYPHAVPKYLQRLKAIRATLKASTFFATHEVVGSSLLFVHDATDAGIWMIDFAKTLPLPPHLKHIRHDAEWQVGNHEDGYLIGVNNLIDIFQDIRDSEP